MYLFLRVDEGRCIVLAIGVKDDQSFGAGVLSECRWRYSVCSGTTVVWVGWG